MVVLVVVLVFCVVVIIVVVVVIVVVVFSVLVVGFVLSVVVSALVSRFHRSVFFLAQANASAELHEAFAVLLGQILRCIMFSDNAFLHDL